MPDSGDGGVKKSRSAVFSVNIAYNRIKNRGVRMDALRKEEIYTMDDIYALPEGERAVLIIE